MERLKRFLKKSPLASTLYKRWLRAPSGDLPEADRQKLRAFLFKDVQQLSALLGIEVPWSEFHP